MADELSPEQLRQASDAIFAAADIPTDEAEAYQTFYNIFNGCTNAGFTKKQALWIVSYGIFNVGNIDEVQE